MIELNIKEQIKAIARHSVSHHTCGIESTPFCRVYGQSIISTGKNLPQKTHISFTNKSNATNRSYVKYLTNRLTENISENSSTLGIAFDRYHATLHRFGLRLLRLTIGFNTRRDYRMPTSRYRCQIFCSIIEFTSVECVGTTHWSRLTFGEMAGQKSCSCSSSTTR